MVYVPARKAWLPASALLKGDKLLHKDNVEVEVADTKPIDELKRLAFIVVEKNHNYVLNDAGILVHNGPICGCVGYWGVKIGSYVGICAGTATATAVASGALATGAVTGGLVAGGSAWAAGASGMGIASGALATGLGTAGGLAGIGTVGGTVCLSTSAALQASATIAATTVAVESLSTTVGLALFSCPFLP